MENKTIAIFLPSLAGGGAEKMMLNLAKGFVDSGYSVDLLLVNKKGPYIDLVPNKVNLIDFQCNKSIKSLPKLIRYLKEKKPNSIISTLEFIDIITIWAKLIAKVKTKVVIRVPNNLIEHAKHEKKFKNKIYPILVKWFYPLADEIIAISKGVAKSTSKLTGINYEDINVIYNPVVNEKIESLSKEDNSHQWFKNYPVILGVGRLTEQKNFSCLIDAFSLVRKEVKSKLIILGEGEKREELQEQINKLGLSGEVDLPGFKKNPYSFMRNAKVFVLSSNWEGFGNVLVEAMAMGTPVVSTDCESGPREILDNGKYGLLAPINNHQKLAEKILTSLNSPIEKSFLDERVNDFSVDSIKKEYLKVLK